MLNVIILRLHFYPLKLSVFILDAVMLSVQFWCKYSEPVIMLNVVMLSVIFLLKPDVFMLDVIVLTVIFCLC